MITADTQKILYIGPPVIRISEDEIPNVLFTSDLHLRHKGILYYTNRRDWNVSNVDEMEEYIIHNLNEAIDNLSNEKKKYLINCGDMLFGTTSNAYAYYSNFINQIHPVKAYNVVGNHEVNNLFSKSIFQTVNDAQNLENSWVWSSMYIMEIYRGTQCVCRFTISHQPLETYHGCMNIHGHLHTPENLDNYHTTDREFALKYRADGRHIDVGVDRWEGKPVKLSDILENKTDIQINKIPQLQSMKWKYNN